MFKMFRSLLLSLALLGAVIVPVQAHAEVATSQFSAYAGETVVTVYATIRELRGYDSDYEHQQILVDNIEVLDIENGSASEIPDRAFVAIRIDEQGTDGSIPGLRVGAPIEIKGEFIPEDEAYKTPANCCDAVIHFTHDPLGYVYYNGVLYR